MINLSETDKAINWLQQFALEDQQSAAELIDAMTLVSTQEFIEQTRQLILERAQCYDVVGLYAEREVGRDEFWQPVPLFKTEGTRAYGGGPQPIEALDLSKPEVGSEGIIANLITEICREQPTRFLNHPGPDVIRKSKVRAFFLVTDLIGSGNQSKKYLESAWKIASVKSWYSLKLFKFEVIAYAATEPGAEIIRRHRSNPEVSFAVPCPTLTTKFKEEKYEEMRLLCEKYNPLRRKKVRYLEVESALGYQQIGALIVFGHGCPNNAPTLLYKGGKRNSWKPLFPARTVSATRAVFGERDDINSLSARLVAMGQTRLAEGIKISTTTEEGKALIMLLAALQRGPRSDVALAQNSNLKLPRIRILVKLLQEWGWVTNQRRLTDSGLLQLQYVRNLKIPLKTIAIPPLMPYFPSSLRAP